MFRKAIISLNHSHERLIAPIVGDGAIANPDVGDGRMFPLVILDTTERPDIDAAIAAHDQSPQGDVNVQWGRMPERADTVMLVLTFIRPVEAVVLVEFVLDKHHGILIEQVLSNNGLYIQAGRPGDRLRFDVNRPKILAEIPETGFRSTWDRIYLSSTAARLRRKGLSRSDAKRAARNAVEQARAIALTRPNFKGCPEDDN